MSIARDIEKQRAVDPPVVGLTPRHETSNPLKNSPRSLLVPPTVMPQFRDLDQFFDFLMGKGFEISFKSWTAVNPIMMWMNRIVPKLYGWSDLVIKHRQEKVNYKYRIEKAEKKAYEIMRAQQEQRAKTALNGTLSVKAEGVRRRRKRAFREWDVEY